MQSLCNDVRRLLLLAYPDSHDVVCDVVGRDAFLAALDNPSLRTRILDQRPSSLDDALDMACRMEAYTPTNNEEPSYTDADRDRLDRRRARQVRADNRNYEENRQIKELRSQLADRQREIRQLKADADTWRAQAEAGARPPSASVAQLTNQWPSVPPSQSPEPYCGPQPGWDYNPGHSPSSPYYATPTSTASPRNFGSSAVTSGLQGSNTSTTQQPQQFNRQPKRRLPVTGDVRYNCKGARSCPVRDQGSATMPVIGDPRTSTTPQATAAHANGVSANVYEGGKETENNGEPETYLDITINQYKNFTV